MAVSEGRDYADVEAGSEHGDEVYVSPDERLKFLDCALTDLVHEQDGSTAAEGKHCEHLFCSRTCG